MSKPFKATNKQIEELQNALKGGAPLLIALQYAGISRATYYYWVAVASIVIQYKSQEELEEVDEMFHSGISLQQVRDLSESAASNKRSGIGTFIEPSEESMLQYKNNAEFRKFANKCYQVVTECDKIRSGVALLHLSNIRKSTDKASRINASGSMWFLERTIPDFFAKPSDKLSEQSNEKTHVESLKVEYVDPGTEESKKRLKDMENELEALINGEVKA